MKRKTGLYALAELQHSVIDHYYLNNGNNPTYREDVEIIAKELKALEILKKKGDLSALIDAKNVDDFNWYLCCEDKEHEFTEEEFELLKEVLE